jgi:hypothetical protein
MTAVKKIKKGSHKLINDLPIFNTLRECGKKQQHFQNSGKEIKHKLSKLSIPKIRSPPKAERCRHIWKD